MQDALWDVVEGRVSSEFLELSRKTYRDLGARRARSAMALMGRYQELRPGYYGPRGTELIIKTVAGMFLTTRKLKMKHTTPQSPREFAYEVLVPEVALRLIGEDRGIELVEARMVMKESAAFGEVVHDVEDDVSSEEDE